MEDRISDVQDYTERVINNVIDGLPNFVGALALVVVFYLVAKATETATDALSHRLQLNNRLHMGHGGDVIQRAIPNPAEFVSRVVFWVVFLFGVSVSVGVLGVTFLNDILRSVYGYLPNVFAALGIFLAGSGLAISLTGVVTNTFGETIVGKLLATSTPLVVMSVAIFMILNQLKIAPEIVTITYAAIVGSAALGMALAFGLGGRDIASSLLQNMYEKTSSESGEVADSVKKTAGRVKSKV